MGIHTLAKNTFGTFKTFNISTKEHLTTTRVKLKLYFDFQIDLFNNFFPFFPAI